MSVPAVFLSAAVFLGAFAGSLIQIPRVLRYLRRRGFVVPDRYKIAGGQLVTHAGLLGLGIGVCALVVTLILTPPPSLFDLYPAGADNVVVALQLTLFTACAYGIVGAVDDLRPLSHAVKAAVPATLALPVAALAVTRLDSTTAIVFLPWQADWILLLLVPVYVLGVTNLVNMHSGFNGLQSGLSLMLLGTLILRLWLGGLLEGNLLLPLVAGFVAAFYPFNRLPAKAIEGNVGSYFVGATIGVGIAVNGLFVAGLVMLAPHILDFLLFVYGKATGHPFAKYGRIRSDGTIEAPYPYKLKFLVPYYLRTTERQTVRFLYGLTLLSCAVSFLVPY